MDLRVPTFIIKPASIRIYTDSTIRYSARINYDVACRMHFHMFPHDSQHCEIKFESFGFTSHQMQLRWREGSNINPNISLAQVHNNCLIYVHG